jgi:hypothetical protein
MDEQDWLHHYRYRLRSSDRKMLANIRYITNNPITCTFPWDPTTNPVIPTQERTPPLANAPNPLEHPVQGDESDEDITEEAPVRRARRRSADSDEEYQGQRANAQANQEEEEALVAPRRRQNERAAIERANMEKVQCLLRTFAPKLKYQRYIDERPVVQPAFETSQYRDLAREHFHFWK